MNAARTLLLIAAGGLAVWLAHRAATRGFVGPARGPEGETAGEFWRRLYETAGRG
jgi:hypothetical protein